MSEDLTKKLPGSDSETITQFLQNIDTRLQHLEQKVDERLYDTRPIWEKVVVDVAQLQKGQQRLEEMMTSEFREIKTSIRDIFRRFSIFNDTLVTMQIDYRDIYDRVRSIEIQQNPTNSST